MAEDSPNYVIMKGGRAGARELGSEEARELGS